MVVFDSIMFWRLSNHPS